MTETYPIILNLSGRRCVVAGGGPVAERKVEGLLAADAAVFVIAPEVTANLRQRAASRRITLYPRPFQPDDLDGAMLVIAATNDSATNAAIWQAARQRGVLINAVDDPPHCDFIAPAIVRRGPVAVALSTGGASPALAAHLRRQIEATLGDEVGILAEVLGELRPHVMQTLPDIDQRTRFWKALVTDDLLELTRREGRDAARALVEAFLSDWLAGTRDGASDKEESSLVYLVGGGPGDPGLLTMRGAACLARADVVLYDRLVNLALLDLAPPGAEHIYVGKAPHQHTFPQEVINQIIIDRARAGQTVVRLHGGDAFVFGRGGEEAEALVAAGIPFEIVPGVTSAIAAPAYAGIPVTHRGYAASFAVVTGHRRADADKPLPPIPDASTLVFLMPVSNLPSIVERLLAEGRPPDTPAALIHRGTTPRQRTVTGTLTDIVNRAEGIKPPAVFIVGPVVLLQKRLAWFERRLCLPAPVAPVLGR